MAIHMEIEYGGEDYKVTLSRDEAGNYVAEAARLLRGGSGVEVPRVRVVDRVKDRALRALFESLSRLAPGASRGPDAPAAA
jgi:hypothetical protein